MRSAACILLGVAYTANLLAAEPDLIAHWNFEQAGDFNAGDPNVGRSPGAVGKALHLSGKHHVTVPVVTKNLKTVSLSAWVKPTAFQQYNEIFRKEDGDNRILFSFQKRGTVLALGLNIGGYVECDAPLDPARLLDGLWHHCAGTFDGEFLRVYLDGAEIGKLHRPGRISAGGAAPGCIGSSNGGECFQGDLDELRIYSRVLSRQEIGKLVESVPVEQRFAVEDARSRMEGMLERICCYRPLTEDQWQALTPSERAHWERIAAIKQQVRTLEAASDPSELHKIVQELEEYDRATVRPSARESAAPHVARPQTPETRSLNEAEAQAVLQQDWLFQADGKPTPDRIRQEVGWARELADRIAADCQEELAKLSALEKQIPSERKLNADLYYQVRAVKRSIQFKNPVVDFTKVLFVDMPFPKGSEWRHETKHRLGYMAVPGARLLTLEGLSPAGRLNQIMPQKPLHGSFWRPDVSWDGQRILFCFQAHNEKSFHLYEINVDGTGLRRLTHGPYDDLDPIYLPDGEHILFTSTRGNTYVRCMPPTNSFVLTRCDLNGENIYIVSRNNEPDYLPSVMEDGKVVYTRWEYTDKALWRAQGLWTVKPDGTQVNVLWGNQSVWPDLLKDARSIPGSRRIMFTGAGHHRWFAGSVGIIDPSQGLNFPDGLTKVTADVAWPEVGNGPSDPIESPKYHRSGNFTAYYSPYPLSEKDFLVSARRGQKFMLYLMDVDGNRELIYEGAHQILHAIPVKPRGMPPVQPDLVAWPTAQERLSPKEGVIFSNNVYEGVPDQLKGRAKYLRVLSIDAKTYTYWHKREHFSSGPAISGIQAEGVKRILGTVPVEQDGSVSFNAPSGIPLHFQLLDEKYRALRTMRSFTGVMPGESRGCVGCHERRSNTPQYVMSSKATTRAPSDITPPPWNDRTVSWTRYVRPVLDKHCAECHQGDGKALDTLDMTPRPGPLGWDEMYWLFTGKFRWNWAKQQFKPQEDPPPGYNLAGAYYVEGYHQMDPKHLETPEPMTALSYKSPLVELISSGKHHKVQVDELSRRRVIAWVDAMCPYRGDEEVRAIDDPVFAGIDWLAVQPRVKTAPRIVRPGPLGFSEVELPDPAKGHLHSGSSKKKRSASDQRSNEEGHGE